MAVHGPRRRKNRGAVSRLRYAMISVTVFCLASLAWLSQVALPSSSHKNENDLALAARLDGFAARRNLSSEDAKKQSEAVLKEEQNILPELEANRAKKAKVPDEEATKVAETAEYNPKPSETGAKQAQIQSSFLNSKRKDRIVVNSNGKLMNIKGRMKNVRNRISRNGRVQVLKTNECMEKSTKGHVVELIFEAHVETMDGLIYASSQPKPEKIELGKNELILSLDENLLGACPGDRRLITMSYPQTVDVKTSNRFKLNGNSNLVVWDVTFVSVGVNNADDDDDMELFDDDGVETDGASTSVDLVTAEDKWKDALGLIETVEKEVVVEEEREIVANVTGATNATNATETNNVTTTTVKVKTKKKVMVRQPMAVLETPTVATMVPFHPSVPYLGVLVDGGRHYFPLEWLKKLVDDLYMMRFNFIHFRLTDDQAFNVKLKSHPELALPAPATAEDPQDENPVWTTDELRDLVKYAEQKNITIMPEINAPGHCGSWSGVEGLVMPCPMFACQKGYGVPLNETSPKLMGVLKNVIKEVSEIFHTSPFLHLGGDEVHMSKACYQEIDEVMPDYNNFEVGLKQVLKELGISEDKVVRWETTGQKGINTRAGDMVQWWEAFPKNKRREGEFFVSQGLYFDSCGERAAQEFFDHTHELVNEDPKGIIAGTFELGTHWWEDRNVYGRLLAVAMGASREGQSLPWSSEMYVHFCRSLGWSDETCLADGKPLLHTNEWLNKWKAHWTTWKAATCDRLTEPYDVRLMNALSFDAMGEPLVNSRKEVALSVEQFWDSFGGVPTNRPRVNKTAHTHSLLRSVVPHLGVTWDISVINDLEKAEKLVNDLSRLGFNLIHLRLLDDFSFPLTLVSHPRIAWDGNVLEEQNRKRTWTKVLTMSKKKLTKVARVKEFVKVAASKGIKVMPEISVVSRAGGWFSSGLVAQCPHVMCDTDYGIPLDITYPAILSMVYNVIYELRTLFSSEYFHLGYDERNESAACFDELKVSADFDVFEDKLMKMLQLQGISPSHVLRWESSDGVEKKFRAGNVTHYHSKLEPESREKNSQSMFSSWLGGSEVEPFFVSTGLGNDENDENRAIDAWTIYRRTRRLVQAGPTGILAQYLLSKDETVVGANNDMGKIIAVAIGASSLPKMNKGKFRQVFIKTCGDLNQSSCSKLAENALPSSEIAEERLLKSKCERLTHVERRRKMKPGI